MPNIDAWVKQVQSFPSHLPPKMESNNEQYIGHSHSGPPIQSRKNTLNKTKLNRLQYMLCFTWTNNQNYPTSTFQLAN